MSDLASDLESLLSEVIVQPHQKRCSISVVLEQITEEQREKLEVLVAPDCRVASGKVAAVLRNWGFDVGYQSVQRHRRRHVGSGCLCP